jgi:hypothetical protein
VAGALFHRALIADAPIDRSFVEASLDAVLGPAPAAAGAPR